MAEHWRVGRHVPHHVYRGDGNTVADEVAVAHRPEDAAQIVAEHSLVRQYRAALERIRLLIDAQPVLSSRAQWALDRVATIDHVAARVLDHAADCPVGDPWGPSAVACTCKDARQSDAPGR